MPSIKLTLEDVCLKPVTTCKRQFLKGLRELCDELYSLGDSARASSRWREQSAMATGFIKAGLLLDVVSKDEVEKVIGASHFRAFGETRADSRARRKSNTEDGNEDIDWSLYDSPSVLRK